MPRTGRLRGLVALPAATLLASLVTITGPAAAPAAADPGCLTEAFQSPLPLPLPVGTRCDDEVPPVMDPNVTVTPTPRTAQNWVGSKQLTFAFTGRFTDGDTDPLGFECQFYATTSAPTSWTACGTYDEAAKVWKQTYTDLDETDAVPYTFRVRAVDTADAAIDATSRLCLCIPASTDVEDVSAPVTVQARVDTIVPAGSARINGLVDEENPEWPMVTDRTVQVVLGAGGSQDRSPVDFACTLNSRSVPCATGTTDLRNLPPGDQRFEAVARDAAGNVDPTPAVLKFSVPRNLKATGKAGKKSPWKVVRQGGYFAGDFLQTSTVGAVVTAPGKNVRELRLIAPRGPKLGKVEVKIGQSIWRTVNLKGPRYERFHVYQVRDQFDPLVSGRIQVRAKKIGRGETVRIDAVLAH
ncbi:hypothetical protein [Nocardioides deserti]|uniref:Ig-like domain-containing protein n=1 Tax=Nocardioides deserti TaxID=1588644 RepID=A0ABR6U5W8_9ACTN|nr:hypothetical protein [Nocardioides deserti]MBC2959553.1 hypothetical protein [Nocardioides deserti]GGO73873.1 hypothetical protein GCM10012276_20530 [Nocardioides deserti]